MKQLLPYDTKDDRREVFILFDRLSPAKRVQFLRWCCTKSTAAKLSPYIQPNHSGLTMECVLDFYGLIGQYGLNADFAFKALERFVRKG